ncbi:MAG: hypothetical protein Q9182_005096 [Xanthomendoza sp. 2 TL-2023]
MQYRRFHLGSSNRPVSENRTIPTILITPPAESHQQSYIPDIDTEACRNGRATATGYQEPDPQYLCPPPNTFRAPRHCRTPSTKARLGTRAKLHRNYEGLFHELKREMQELRELERRVIQEFWGGLVMAKEAWLKRKERVAWLDARMREAGKEWKKAVQKAAERAAEKEARLVEGSVAGVVEVSIV